MAEYLDRSGLTEFWTKIKSYVGNEVVKGVKSLRVNGVTADSYGYVLNYGICEDSDSYASKSVNVPNFYLNVGVKVNVLFKYAVARSNPTLNVSSTGPKEIYYKEKPIPSNYIKAETWIELVYYNNHWNIVGDLANGQGGEVTSDITGNAGTATKLKTARAIDGVTFDGSAARSHYGICGTSAGTTAKTVYITGFTLVTGARVIVRFTYANTASSPTLNVSSTGAKAIYYKNAVIPAGYIQAYSMLELVYDGSYWRVVGDLTQSQADELSTNFSYLKKPVSLYSGSKCNTAQKTWEYVTISNLNNYTEIEFWVTIGDMMRKPVRINKNNAQQLNFSVYFNANYNASLFVLVDWVNSRIGVYTSSLTGWTYSSVNISKVVGVIK